MHQLTHGHMEFTRPRFGRFLCCYTRSPWKFMVPKKKRMKMWFMAWEQEAFPHDVSDLAFSDVAMLQFAHAPDVPTALNYLKEYRKNHEYIFESESES